MSDKQRERIDACKNVYRTINAAIRLNDDEVLVGWDSLRRKKIIIYKCACCNKVKEKSFTS